MDDLIAAAGYTADGPGVAVAVRDADGRVHRAASGLARPDAPFTTNTVSYLASVAKQMVGVCAAMLVVDGRLDVESTVRRWLPELPGWADSVRIRHLIHHTGGLPGDPELQDRVAEPRWDSPAVLRALAACPEPQFPAGRRYEYCNAGYISLVAVIERLTGTPFADLARRELFEPLGMAHTEFRADAPPADAAEGRPTVEAECPLPLSVGDGGAWSTADDMQRWNDALLPGGALNDRVKALSARPGRLDDGRPIDYAWGVLVNRRDGVLMHSHGGSWSGGWTATTVRLPERGITIAALSNDGDVSRMVDLTDRILAAVSR
ncbi:serine hydrolase domain-containing protein [Kutzneria kofuensis]|uniref:CubicO group peptidase (Beta-lactamase class C family) n=1 Tax=Kutzneria kofuensis TaxID=103725 RepID=A0A7W9KL69_9PSEU|nr:serine hydrolase domain-containing protein [Kutzneria kofuensis]MBB5894570.1 CubicO group peptidase (beta-lactamase class C family) [Kutzneria kofuensis]